MRVHVCALLTAPDDQPRAQLLELVGAIEPWNDLEHAHLKTREAGLWLRAGGHVEPGEDPWATVVRKCREELGIEAVASPITDEHPPLARRHPDPGDGLRTEFSLWYLLNADSITTYDRNKFDAIRWLTDEQVLEESDELLDPHMHRCTRKLKQVRTTRRG